MGENGFGHTSKDLQLLDNVQQWFLDKTTENFSGEEDLLTGATGRT